MSEFFKPLTKGTEDIISRTPVEPNKLRFTTDTGKLYLDTDGGRVEFTDIIDDLTDIQINLLEEYSDKIYLAKDTSRLYVYNRSKNQLIEIANTATNVDHANSASYTTDPDDPAELDRIASEKWTNNAIAEAIGEVTQFNILVVDELPVTGEANTIYFVPSEDPEIGNTYEEYMWLNNKWELLGTTKIDLSSYYNSYSVTGTGSFISSVSANGNTITFNKSSTGTVSYATNAGTALKATNADTAAYATAAGNATHATNASSAGYATNAGTADQATHATNADTSTYASNSGTAVFSSNAGTAAQSTNADTATYAVNAGTAVRATNADTATYAVNAGSASYADHGVESIEREGDTSVFKVTRSNGTTLSFTQLDPGSASYSYTAADGIQVTDDRKIRNLGILAVATGSSNGTVKITTCNTNGETSTSDVAVKGLGNLAYVSSTTATTANYAKNAGTATKATNADSASYSTNAGSASYATSAGDGIASLSTSGNDIVITKTNGATTSVMPPLHTKDGVGQSFVSGTNYLVNTGVRSIAQGTTNGTINVNTNGSTANVSVKGLGNLAYLSSTTATTANYGIDAGHALSADSPYGYGDIYWDFGIIKSEYGLAEGAYTWDPVNLTKSSIVFSLPSVSSARVDTIYFINLYAIHSADINFYNLFDAYILSYQQDKFVYWGRCYLEYYED